MGLYTSGYKTLGRIILEITRKRSHELSNTTLDGKLLPEYNGPFLWRFTSIGW